MEWYIIVIFIIIFIWLIRLESFTHDSVSFNKWLADSFYDDHYLNREKLLKYIFKKYIVEYRKDTIISDMNDYKEKLIKLQENLDKFDKKE